MVALKSLIRARLNQAVRSLPNPHKVGLRCLLYHSIVADERQDPGQMTTPLRLFKEQMAYLAGNGYQVISCTELVRRIERGEMSPHKTVALSFDDGEVGLHEFAMPVLQEYRFPATVFLIAEAPGGRHLTWEQARQMRSSGLVEFGCHSGTHRHLRGLSDEDLTRETAGAKRRIEEALGCEVSLFAYPFGSYGTWDRRVLRALKGAGFKGAFTSVVGLNALRTDYYLLRRNRVSWLEEIAQFQCLLEGAGDWYAWVQRIQGMG